jgi:hypothetical protein
VEDPQDLDRSAIERMARENHLFSPVEEVDAVLIKTTDVPKLLKGARKAAKRIV